MFSYIYTHASINYSYNMEAESNNMFYDTEGLRLWCPECNDGATSDLRILETIG